MTGSPRARASVTTIPYGSTREASTSTSAAAYAFPSRRRSARQENGPGHRSRLLGPKPQLFDEHGLAVERPDADAPPRQIRDGGQRSEQNVVALVPGDRGDAQQLTAPVRSRYELGGVDPGWATCTLPGGSA